MLASRKIANSFLAAEKNTNTGTLLLPNDIMDTVKIAIDADANANIKAEVLPTSTFLDTLISRIDRGTPFNLDIFTNYIRATFIDRIAYIESLVIDTRFVRFLSRLGIPSTYPFLIVVCTLIWLITKSYKNSRTLVMAGFGVIYPAFKTIQAVDLADMLSMCDGVYEEIATTCPSIEGLNGKVNDNVGYLHRKLLAERTRIPVQKLLNKKLLDEQKQWMTYWFLFGWLHIMDHFSTKITTFIPMWEYIKILALWWAQNPQSRGATVVYDTFIRSLLRENPKKTSSRPPRTVIDSQSTRQNSYVLKREIPPISTNIAQEVKTLANADLDIAVIKRSPTIDYVPEEKMEEIWSKDASASVKSLPYAT